MTNQSTVSASELDDISGWRYSYGGRPFELARTFLDLLTGKADAIPLVSLVTQKSLATWTAFFKTVNHEEWRQKSYGIAPMVRHPGPDICYVMCMVMHPDQTEPVVIKETTKVSADLLTLLYDNEVRDWRVHCLGAPAPPESVGREPFPKPS